jgi:hypothetical protein
MPANLFAAIRPGIVATQRPGIVAAQRPGIVATQRRNGSSRRNGRGESCRRIYSPLFAQGSSQPNARGSLRRNGRGESCRRIYSPLFARGYVPWGEFIRRYSPHGMPQIKKPSPMAVGEGCAGGVMAGESLPQAGAPAGSWFRVGARPKRALGASSVRAGRHG